MKLRVALLIFLLIFLPQTTATAEETKDPFEAARKKMVDTQIRLRGVSDKNVLRAMESVPRHLFVPEPLRAHAYSDRPLALGFGQTISQPHVVAVMTELLGLSRQSRVLEVGTGSGYQAAVLAKIVNEVFSIENLLCQSYWIGPRGSSSPFSSLPVPPSDCCRHHYCNGAYPLSHSIKGAGATCLCDRTQSIYPFVSIAVSFCQRSYPEPGLPVQGNLRGFDPSRWITTPPKDVIKMANTVIHALNRSGIREEAEHLILVRSLQTATLIVSNQEFSQKQIAVTRDFCSQRLFDTIYYPGINSSQGNLFIRTKQPVYHDAIQALFSDRAREFERSYPFDITPAVDNRPYFYHFFRWKLVDEIRQTGTRTIAFTEWGYLILLILMAIALLTGSALTGCSPHMLLYQPRRKSLFP